MRQYIKSIRPKLLEGQLTVSELVDQYLHQIVQSKDLNIYVEVFEEEVKAKAQALDKKLAKGETIGALFGLVISIKDVICYEGHEVTAGSKILENYHSPFSSTALQALLDQDALVIGRVNCDEFAMGSSNEHSIYGPTKNGFNSDYVPGGSSGASAVSVQMRTCAVSLGSDTGGSVRQPAAFCGVHGFKPSYGAISRYGLIAYASSFDQIGILANDRDDIQTVLNFLSVYDPKDATSVENFLQKPTEKKSTYKIAYFKEALSHKGLDQEIKSATLEQIAKWKEAGHQVDEIEFSMLDSIIPAYYIMTTAESSSNLSRYDGVKFGYRSPQSDDLQSMYINTRTEGFGPEVKKRIMLGSFVLSSGYYDAYFLKAQRLRGMLVNQMEQIFKEYDFVAMPVSPCFPWKIGDVEKDPLEIYLSDVFTVLANLCGLPAYAFPIQQADNGFSISIQLMAKKSFDYHLFDLA